MSLLFFVRSSRWRWPSAAERSVELLFWLTSMGPLPSTTRIMARKFIDMSAM